MQRRLCSFSFMVSFVIISLFLGGCDIGPGDLKVVKEIAGIEYPEEYFWVDFTGKTFVHVPVPSDHVVDDIGEWSWNNEPGMHYEYASKFTACVDKANFKHDYQVAEAYLWPCRKWFSQSPAEKEFNKLYGSNWATYEEDWITDHFYTSPINDEDYHTYKDPFYSKCNINLDLPINSYALHDIDHDVTNESCTEAQAIRFETKEHAEDFSYMGIVDNNSYVNTTVHLSGDDFSTGAIGLYSNSGKFSYGFDKKTKCTDGVCDITLGKMSGKIRNYTVRNDNGSAYVENINFYLNRRSKGKYFPDTKTAIFEPGEVQLIIRYIYHGIDSNRVIQNKARVIGHLDPESNEYTFGGHFGNNKATLDIRFSGNYSHIPPTAQIIAPSTAECTDNYAADVLVDGSSLPFSSPKTHLWWVKNASGNFIRQSFDSNIAELTIPVGENIIRHKVIDSDQIWDVTTTSIVVEDTTPPVLSVDNQSYQVCVPDGNVVQLEIPTVTDACTDSSTVDVKGFIKSMNGANAGMIPVAANGDALLPQGESVIVWQAEDTFGNTVEVEQIVTVVLDIGPWCCEDGQTLIEGTSGADTINVPASEGPVCVFGHGSQDNLFVSSGDTCDDDIHDFIFGGDSAGGDYITSRSCDSVVVAGNGAGGDYVYDYGDATIYGGNGADFLSGYYYGGDNIIYGGFGADYIDTGAGNDTIYPGPGADYVNANIGDDTVIIYDACELVAGKTLNGGYGNDTIYLPVSATETAALGVVVIGFENILLTDPDLKGLSNCI